MIDPWHEMYCDINAHYCAMMAWVCGRLIDLLDIIDAFLMWICGESNDPT